MRPSEALTLNRDTIRTIVLQNRGRNPRVFGSVLHGNDGEGSDLDLLIDPDPGASLMDIARIQNRLETLLGVSVDVLTPLGLPEGYRNRVLAEASPV